jgi:hypothetical protein
MMRSWRWRATRHDAVLGVASHLTYFKMPGKNAFGRDSQAGLRGDQEHYACCC